ncbi:MAG TPA: toxic anion resistance protein, partial [Steroidobacteraceae bacterium]|nr:toxic anion resistance protein [Steroidobacteraceae bacterium]
LRQRIMDLQQQLLVNQQGFLTMEMIIRNNKELIRGVNRALNVTVSALQVAVTLALALANQKIVLEKVQAITSTTEKLIAGTAERLKTQGAEIHKQASSTQLNLDVLKQAFGDIRAALDDVSRYRQEALPKMAQSIVDMDKMSKEAEEQIRKVEHAEKAAKDFPIEIVG